MSGKISKRVAGVYQSGSRLIVNGKHKLVSWAHLNLADAVGVDEGDVHGLGEAVRSALSRYQTDVPMPIWSEIKGRYEKSVAKAAGAKSYSAMLKGGAKHISIVHADGLFELIPWKRQGLSFVGFDEAVPRSNLVPDTASDEELANAIKEALSRAE